MKKGTVTRKAKAGKTISNHFLMQFFLTPEHMELLQTWCAEKSIMLSQQDRYIVVSTGHSISNAVEYLKEHLRENKIWFKEFGYTDSLFITNKPMYEEQVKPERKPRPKYKSLAHRDSKEKSSKHIIRRPLFGGTRTRVIVKEVD